MAEEDKREQLVFMQFQPCAVESPSYAQINLLFLSLECNRNIFPAIEIHSKGF